MRLYTFFKGFSLIYIITIFPALWDLEPGTSIQCMATNVEKQKFDSTCIITLNCPGKAGWRQTPLGVTRSTQ